MRALVSIATGPGWRHATGTRASAVFLLAIAAMLSASLGAPAARSAVPKLGHVFLIVGENTSFEQITPAHAPYLTGTLKPRGAWLTNYHSFTRSSSLGEYIALVSGQYTHCEANNDLPDHCHQGVPNLFQQLSATGRGWRDWEESMANACSPLDSGAAWSKNIYSAHHNPALYFTGIQGGRFDEAIAPKRACRENDLPMGTTTTPDDTSAFDDALASGHVGSFNLIVPNDCEDGHDTCGTHDPVRQFDDFLAREVPKIEASPAFGADGTIVITWDEGADPPHKPGHVLTVVLGPLVKPGLVDSHRYDHYSLERTLAGGFGVQPLAYARKAPAITDIWRPVVAARSASSARLDRVPAFGHTFLIVGENTSLSEVTRKRAPFITGTLRPAGAWLTHYSALADGSLANYVAMVSGQFVRCENNNDFSFTNGDVPGQHACHQSVDNLFHQLDGQGISWQEWTESADNACDIFDHGTTWARNLFSAHHSPAPYFDDIQAHHSSEDVTPSLECRRKVLPTGTNGPDDMSAFDARLATGDVARFDMIIPNDCENGHDQCGTRDPVHQFDNFLAREVPKIEGSPAFGTDGLIIVVWDEGDDPPLAPLHVGAALIGPHVKPGVTDAQRLTHYSLFRTLEDGFGIKRHLARGATATAVAGIWR